jgi:hypothetical protein
MTANSMTRLHVELVVLFIFVFSFPQPNNIEILVELVVSVGAEV